MKTYATSEEAYQDIFIDIELLYNPNRKCGKNGMLSPTDYVRQQNSTLQDIFKINVGNCFMCRTTNKTDILEKIGSCK
jgi:hypothetical protein